MKRSSRWLAKNASGQSETAHLSNRKARVARRMTAHIFFHPDYTVGPGISPSLLTLLMTSRRSRARPLPVIPPVGNRTPPRRRNYIVVACWTGEGIVAVRCDPCWRMATFLMKKRCLQTAGQMCRQLCRQL